MGLYLHAHNVTLSILCAGCSKTATVRATDKLAYDEGACIVCGACEAVPGVLIIHCFLHVSLYTCILHYTHLYTM